MPWKGWTIPRNCSSRLPGISSCPPPCPSIGKSPITPARTLNLGISHSLNLTKEITLDLGASIGYQISDTDKIVKYNSQLQPTTDKYNALHDGNLSVGLTIPFAKYFSVKPVICYSLPLSDDAKYRIQGTSLSNKYDFLYGGLILTASF